MDLAFVDKRANQNNEVKFLLDAVDNFSRFVRVQAMKTKYAGHFASFRKKIFSEKHS